VTGTPVVFSSVIWSFLSMPATVRMIAVVVSATRLRATATRPARRGSTATEAPRSVETGASSAEFFVWSCRGASTIAES
jgi:hypothetical protein